VQRSALGAILRHDTMFFNVQSAVERGEQMNRTA
jgi:hypothetical protein